ncbi:hypothetical protein ACTUVN_004783 [Pseudomonas caspiana]
MSNSRNNILIVLENSIAKGGGKLSVASLAKEARISRSTIYKYYPDIVLKVKRHNGDQFKFDKDADELKKSILSRQLKESKQIIAALAKACSEQLIKLIECNSRHIDELESRDLKILYLEKKIQSLLIVKRIK